MTDEEECVHNSQKAVASKRAVTLFQAMCQGLHRDTDRFFVPLMLLQWIGGIVMAIVISPQTWIGATSHVHLHVFAAVFLGGLLSGMPIFMAIKFPGARLTRHVIAVAQMLWSALLIHLSGGRIETHFHVFGSLAFLATYRDWRVLVTATIVVAADHFVRGVLWPQSVFGVFVESPFLWLEHASWVVFEDVFLLFSCRRSINEMQTIAERQTALEETNESVEAQIQQRTSQLQSLNQQLEAEMLDRERAEARVTRLGRLLKESLQEIFVFDAGTLKFIEVNHGALENLGYSMQELADMTPLDLTSEYSLETFEDLLRPLRSGDSNVLSFETVHRRRDGTTYPAEVRLQLSNDDEQEAFVSMVADITQRQQAEAERDVAQQELIETSRQAGMAEIATGVLHNVGNVLNSVNVSANLVTDKLRTSRVDRLQQIAALFAERGQDLGDFLTGDDKGRRLPAYLHKLAEHLVDEHQSMTDEVGSLNENIKHIKEIVQMQQSYASMSGMAETVSLADLLEDALKVNLPGIARHHIELVREFGDVPALVTEKNSVLQILINLISNARKAMREVSNERVLTLRLDEVDGMARIEVADTGVGIPPENLNRIFTHGFTTRDDGHGFGLHSSAISAKKIGGSLSAMSDGPGHGATLTLRLPMEIDQNLAAPEMAGAGSERPTSF